MSGTNLGTYVPVFVAILTVLAGFVGYLFQRRNELLKSVRDAKRNAYTGYVKNFCKLVGSEEDKAEAIKEGVYWRTEILFYGSDEVIRAYRRSVEVTGDIAISETFNKMLLEMRKDCMSETQVTLEDISAMSPIQLPKEPLPS